MEHTKKRGRASVILAVLLILAVGYIALDAYQEAQAEQQVSLLQQGAQFGYEQAIVQLMQQAATCQAVPLTVNGSTVMNIIAVECLQETP